VRTNVQAFANLQQCLRTRSCIPWEHRQQ